MFFKPERVFFRMPGKPRKTPAGFVSMHDLARIARERNRPFSLAGFKSRLAKGRIRVDATDLNKYRPQALFFENRVDGLLSFAPKQMLRTQGKLSEFGVLELARKINPKIYQRQVQRFFEIGDRLTTDPRLLDIWQSYRNQKKQDRGTPVPDAIRDQFLQLVRNDALIGLFKGDRKRPTSGSVVNAPKTRTKRKTNPPAKKKIFSPQSTGRAISDQEIANCNSRFHPNIIRLRLMKMLPTYHKSMSVQDFAALLGTTESIAIELARNRIGINSKGRLFVQAIRRAFGLSKPGPNI